MKESGSANVPKFEVFLMREGLDTNLNLSGWTGVLKQRRGGAKLVSFRDRRRILALGSSADPPRDRLLVGDPEGSTASPPGSTLTASSMNLNGFRNRTISSIWTLHQGMSAQVGSRQFWFQIT